jgi:hypothetical protein
MAKYLIEENVDFYKLLQDSLNEENQEDNDSLCLISKMPLTDYHVRLGCGHAFNYVPLYNEIVNQKFRFNNYTYNKYILQCPYCRTIYSNVLPYHEELDVLPIYGVNSEDSFYTMVLDNRTKKLVYDNTLHYFLNGKCCYLHPTECQNTCVIVHAGTSKQYCSLHIQQAKKDYKAEQKEKEKQEKQKKKMEEKEKLKEEKIKAKEEAIQAARCCYVLKSGANKGSQCKNKKVEQNLCKTHFAKENKL